MQYGITPCFNKGYKNILLLGPDVMLDYSNLSFMRNLFPVKSSGFKISLDIVRWIRTAITFVETAKKLVLGNRQGKQKCGSLSI
jgi:hypothetical protein